VHGDLPAIARQNEVPAATAGEKKQSFSRIFLADDDGEPVELLVGGSRQDGLKFILRQSL